MDFLQNLIHRLEVGGGMRYFRIGAAVLALLGLVAGYNLRAYRNMSAQEAMDAAQLGRNLAEGRGYTTQFIRPYSMTLLKAKYQAEVVPTLGEAVPDYWQIKTNHPDISNPPIYPYVLSGLMRVLPFDYSITDEPRPFWTRGGTFFRHQPDFLIAVFNQVLFLLVVALVFFLARRLFDSAIALLSAVLVLGTDLFWRFSVSGLSTTLLMLIFVGICWCLVLYSEEIQEPRGGWFRAYFYAGLAGLLVGLGALTRYSFGWLIIPVALFVALPGGRQRVLSTVLTTFLFLALLGPWVVFWNIDKSGLPFGTATYTVVEGTGLWPEHRLQRSLDPDVKMPQPGVIFHKLLGNLRPVAQGDLLNMTGTWLTAFFLVGLLVGFPPSPARSFRLFLIGALLTLLVVQCLGRTQLSEDSPQINSENLLILLGPLVIVYGVSLFYLLLDQVSFVFRELRYVAIVAFVLLASLPLVLNFLPPRVSPVAFPPYHPPVLQEMASKLKPGEIAMSDMPWAFAWYGDRKAIWLTPSPESFVEIADYYQPISMLFLSPLTMDSKLGSELLRPGSWSGIVLAPFSPQALQRFPLKVVVPNLYPHFMVLTDVMDAERWEWQRKNLSFTNATSETR